MSKNNELLSLLTRRIKGTADLIKDKDADALLVFNRANYRYLTNFTGEEAQLIITKNGDRVLLSDSRFAPQIEAQAVGELKVVMKHGHEAAEIAAEVKKLGVKKLLVEAEFVSAYEYDAIKSQLPDVDLVMAAEIVERVRNVKDDLELATQKEPLKKFCQCLSQVPRKETWAPSSTTSSSSTAATARAMTQLSLLVPVLPGPTGWPATA